MSAAWSAPLTLHELVEHHAARRPQAIAVRAGEEALDYGTLDRHAQAIAAHLEALGVGPGDRVALQQPKSVRAVAELIGILATGAAYVPIDPNTPPERARYILEHCGVKALFAAGRPLKALVKAFAPGDGAASGPALPVPVIAADDVELPAALAPRVEKLGPILAEPRPRARIAVSDRELAYVLYTSGSTGAPKGVAITHAQSLAFVRPATAVFELGPTDVVASHAPFNFDLSIIDLFCTFLAGAEVVLIPEAWLAFPARLAKLVSEAGISVWNSVPSALVQLANHGALDRVDVSRLRLIMFAGEPFPLKHLRRLRALVPGAKLLNVYGQTEANSSTYFEVKALPESDDAPLPVGRTFPGYEVLLLGVEPGDGPRRAITEPDVEGELYVVSGAVASGYWDDPERTALAFVQHPLRTGVRHVVYKTGDRFVRDAAGELVFKGRVDAAVKIRGFRVELPEVEAAAASHPAVHEAAVIALPDEAAGHRLVLFVLGTSAAPIVEADLRAHLAARLPRYMAPEVVLAPSSLPRTNTGKIDRRALVEPAARALAASTAAAP